MILYFVLALVLSVVAVIDVAAISLLSAWIGVQLAILIVVVINLSAFCAIVIALKRASPYLSTPTDGWAYIPNRGSVYSMYGSGLPGTDVKHVQTVTLLQAARKSLEPILHWHSRKFRRHYPAVYSEFRGFGPLVDGDSYLFVVSVSVIDPDFPSNAHDRLETPCCRWETSHHAPIKTFITLSIASDLQPQLRISTDGRRYLGTPEGWRELTRNLAPKPTAPA